MGRRQDLTEYKLGEDIGIALVVHDRDMAPLSLTGVELTFIISDQRTKKKLLTLTTTGGEVANVSAPAGQALVLLPRARQKNLQADIAYWYDLWTTSNTERLHQCAGVFRLEPAVQP